MFSTEHDRLKALNPSEMARPELESTIRELARLESRVVERRLAFTAAIDALDDGGVDGAGVTRVVAKRSSRAAKRAARAGAALTKMPRTRRALADGRINEEHVEAVTAAAERTTPEEADAELAPVAAQLPADMFGKRSRSWAGAKERDAQQQDRHERQRSLRAGRRWTDSDGMRWYLFGLDPVAAAAVEKRLDAETDRLWRADGGRDGTPDAIRTPEQRTADAFAKLITAPPAAGAKRPHPKYQVAVRADVARLRLDDPEGVAELVDGTPLPQRVLERICCDASFAGQVFDTDGVVLWQGRSHRTATDDQWRALIARDGGCRICGADPSRCEAHHIVPFAPPTNGRSDIDNYLLICTHDHHLVHDHGFRLIRSDGEWHLDPPAAERRCRPPRRAA